MKDNMTVSEAIAILRQSMQFTKPRIASAMDLVERAALASEAGLRHDQCPDCKQEDQGYQFCRFCQQHFGPNTNRPYSPA